MMQIIRVVAIALALLTLACSSNGEVSPQRSTAPVAEKAPAIAAPPVEQAPPPAPPLSAVEASKVWLNALRDHDDATLDASTNFPFELHTSGKEGCKGRAVDAASLHKLVACLHREALFEGELKQVAEFPVRVEAALPSWARGLKKTANETIVQSYINGDGITFQLVLVLNGAQARALVLNAEIEGG